MKIYVEYLIRKYLTTESYLKDRDITITECPSFEYDEITHDIKFKTNVPTYKMIILHRIINAYEIPVNNIIVGRPYL